MNVDEYPVKADRRGSGLEKPEQLDYNVAVNYKEDRKMKDEMLDLDNDIIEISDEDGNTFTLEVYDYFFYNGEEYAILKDAEEGSETSENGNLSILIMKVNPFVDENGEEMEEFVPVDEKLLEVLTKLAKNRIINHGDSDDLDDEDEE
jgi:hypothetical protein